MINQRVIYNDGLPPQFCKVAGSNALSRETTIRGRALQNELTVIFSPNIHCEVAMAKLKRNAQFCKTRYARLTKLAQLKPPFETFARIKVVGVGGGGNKAIQRMMTTKIHGVEFVAVNLDAQDLNMANAPSKLLIGKNLTRGLGAGMNPEIGRQAASESKDEIQDALKGSDMVFICYGLGGGTGTGAGPVIAEIARDIGALTVGVVTKPFSFEGAARSRIAEDGWHLLRENVDALITVPNDRLLSIIDRKTPLLEAFAKVDDVLRQGVQGISDLITIPGLINVDFADVRAVMSNSGSALMGIGFASGEDRAIDAAKTAISSPLLEVSIDGARGVLFNISGGTDLAMAEINEAAKIITDKIDTDAKVIFGAVQDDKLKKGEIKVTVIATGFNNGMPKSAGRSQTGPTLFEEAAGNGQVKNAPSPQSNGPVKEVIDATLDDTEFDIPAFIRRKMK